MDAEKILQRQQITETYASFSQSRNGLGKVLGGIAGIAIILLGTLIGPGPVTGVLTIAATLFWLVGKELLRVRLYRPYGTAIEHWSEPDRRAHHWLIATVGVISLGVISLILLSGKLDSPEEWLYLFFVAAAPFITWRFLRTPLEFIVGVFLLAACAVHGSGGAYSLLPDANITAAEIGKILATWSPFIGAFSLISTGLHEHRLFLQLSRQMDALQ